MSDFNPREPIRLSDIDNLLEDSIFNSSNGVRLAEYLRKKRGGGGRVRLHNIFEQVAANMPKPTFNFDMDSSEPNPLPDSPLLEEQPSSSEPEPVAATSAAPEQNGNGLAEVVASSAPTEPASVAYNLRPASPKQIGKSPGPSGATLGRQALLNQFHRTNTAKCELLKQITSSTPKPDSTGTSSHIAAFTTSISPIVEVTSPPMVSEQVAPQVAAVVVQQSLETKQIAIPLTLPVDPVLPAQVLAPCSQAPAPSTPQKVVTSTTPAEPAPPSPDVIIPETPSPVKVSNESPKIAHHIQPRKLTDTFNQLENGMAEESNENITSDESDQEEEEQPPPVIVSEPNGDNSILLKSILKDADARKNRVSLRVSFSQQLVQEREISPAPSIPEAHYSSSSGDDSSDSSDEEYEVIDEVYSDDGAECDPNDIQENYNELVGHHDTLENRMFDIHERPASPLINVEEEMPVRWYETRSPRATSGEKNNDLLAPPATCTKENKTNLQLVDIITDWDEEDDDEEDEQQSKETQEDEAAEREEDKQPAAKEPESTHFEIPETQVLTQQTNETICETIDITNVEDSAERIVELPPLPESINLTTNGLGNMLDSPQRPITPPKEFTNSAKRRFLRENDEVVITRLQSELPASQQAASPDAVECVSETLVGMVQSFRDQPAAKPGAADARKTIVPPRRTRRGKSTIDPATSSYFETVETFVKPTAASKKSLPANQLTTAQRRKLYATTKQPNTPEQLKSVSKESRTAETKNFNIVIRMDDIDNYLQQMTDADRAIVEGSKTCRRKPDVASVTEQSEKIETVAEDNSQAQNADFVAEPEGNDANFAAESDDLQQQLEPTEKVLREPSNSAATNAATQLAESESPESAESEPPKSAESEPPESAEPERVTPVFPTRPQRTRAASRNKQLPSVTNVKSEKPRRQRAKNATELAATTPAEEAAEPGSEIRLTPSEDGLPQTTTQPVSAESANEEHREQEQMISRNTLTSDSADHAQCSPVPSRKRNRPRKVRAIPEPSSVEADKVEPLQAVSSGNGDTSPPVSDAPEAPSTAVCERLDAAPSTSTDGEIASTVDRMPTPSTDSHELAPSVASNSEVPLKSTMLSKIRKLTVVVRRETVSTISNTGGHTTSNAGKASSNVEGPSDVPESQESVPSVAGSSDSVDIVLSDGDKDRENLPLKKRTLRQPSEDEPPVLEPFGGENTVDASDNEPPMLVPHNSNPRTHKQTTKTGGTTHHEKHTSEISEKQRRKRVKFYDPGYSSDEIDETWVPNQKVKKNRHNRRLRKDKETNVNHELEPESEPLRRGSRQRRIATAALSKNPLISSAFDKPIYGKLSEEQLLDTPWLLPQHGSRQPRKPKRGEPASTKESGSALPRPVNRKRGQGEPEEATSSKRNRPDDDAAVHIGHTVSSAPVATCSVATETSDLGENALPMDRLLQGKADSYEWISKLIHGDIEHIPRLPVAEDYAQYTMQNLTCMEHNGIKYSFYIHSETENFGFVRFAPSAVKKLTKTSNFELKFLVMSGNLSFKLNGNKIAVKSGDFLVLPINSRYSIENGAEPSLLFMIKIHSEPAPT